MSFPNNPLDLTIVRVAAKVTVASAVAPEFTDLSPFCQRSSILSTYLLTFWSSFAA